MLELAAGPGETSLELAEMVGPGGRVVCTDHVPNMVAAAEREARERGFDWMTCRVMDAAALDVADAEMDAVVCRLGLMLMPDPEQVVAEARRVLRPGGRLGVVVWGQAAANPWATTWWSVLENWVELPPTPPGGPGMFAMGEPGRVTGMLEAAGFAPARSDPIEMTWEYGSFEHLWDVQSSLNSALSGLVQQLSQADLERLANDARTAIADFRTAAGGYRFPAEAVGALGTVQEESSGR